MALSGNPGSGNQKSVRKTEWRSAPVCGKMIWYGTGACHILEKALGDRMVSVMWDGARKRGLA